MGLEPTTTRLKAGRSTDWANSAVAYLSYKYYIIVIKKCEEAVGLLSKQQSVVCAYEW